MKKVLVLVLTICLLMVSAQAFAAGSFDISVFENVNGIEISRDDMKDATYIDMNRDADSWRDAFFDPGLSDYYYCSFYPSIRINSSGVAVMRWFCDFFGEDWAFIDEIIIKVGDNRYSFSGVDIDRNVVDHGDVLEELGIVFGDEHLAFLQDFAAHCEDGPIKVRLCGDNYDVDFTMSDSMVKWLKTFITLYDEAGALNASYLSDVKTSNTMSTY